MRLLLALLLLFPLAARAQFTSPAMLSAFPSGGSGPPPPPANCPNGSGVAYFVSASGADSNNGTSAGTPWLTITKVNGHSFNAGDCVQFNGGQTFPGLLTIRGNAASTSANPFVVTSYGTGQATVQSNQFGQGNVCFTETCALWLSQSNVNVNNLIWRNGGTLTNPTTFGIQLTGTISNVTFANNDVGGFHEAIMPGYCCESGDIFLQGTFTNVNITGNTVHGVAGVTSQDGIGIEIQGVTGTTTISGNTIFNIGGHANQAAGNSSGMTLQNTSSGSNIQVTHNLVHDNGGATNTCGGPSGILTAGDWGITVAWNEVYLTRNSTDSYPSGVCDYDGIDMDLDSHAGFVEYNYVHNNAGFGLVACIGCGSETSWGPVTYRYNIVEDDGYGVPGYGEFFFGNKSNIPATLYAYGNTMVQNGTNASGGNPQKGVLGTGAGTVGPTVGVIANNIFATTSANHFITCDNYGTINPNWTQTQWRNNDYYVIGGGTPTFGVDVQGSGSSVCSTYASTYAAFNSSTGQTGQTQANPLWVSAPATAPPPNLSWTPATASGPLPGPSGYKLQSGSPMLGAGLDVSSIVGGSMGGIDYFGGTIPTPPNIGAGGLAGPVTPSPNQDFTAWPPGNITSPDGVWQRNGVWIGTGGNQMDPARAVITAPCSVGSSPGCISLSMTNSSSPLQGAEIQTLPNPGYGYGYYETKMKTSAVSGGVASFFLIGAPSYTQPEFDIEFLLNTPGTVDFTCHPVDGSSFQYTLGFDPTAAFHRYGMLWTQGSGTATVAFAVDGTIVHSCTGAGNLKPANGELIMANTWSGNASFGGGPPASTSTTVYDYVQFYPGATSIPGGGGPGNPYTTSFPATENPMSQGGVWVQGATTGLDWGNIQTTPGKAFQVSQPSTYGDPSAVLTGTWGANQTAQGNVYVTASQSQSEVEMRLNTTITAHSITGYEFNCSIGNTGINYSGIVRWNGALGDFTNLGSTSSTGCVNGDLLTFTNVGGVLTAKVNGTIISQVTDHTYTNGSPGIGTWTVGGSASNSWGISNFTASSP